MFRQRYSIMRRNEMVHGILFIMPLLANKRETVQTSWSVSL
ncbi:MAG: hypothetical protein WBI82_04665 [Sphaerochaeta sp.]